MKITQLQLGSNSILGGLLSTVKVGNSPSGTGLTIEEIVLVENGYVVVTSKGPPYPFVPFSAAPEALVIPGEDFEAPRRNMRHARIADHAGRIATERAKALFMSPEPGADVLPLTPDRFQEFLMQLDWGGDASVAVSEKSPGEFAVYVVRAESNAEATIKATSVKTIGDAVRDMRRKLLEANYPTAETATDKRRK